MPNNQGELVLIPLFPIIIFWHYLKNRQARPFHKCSDWNFPTPLSRFKLNLQLWEYTNSISLSKITFIFTWWFVIKWSKRLKPVWPEMKGMMSWVDYVVKTVFTPQSNKTIPLLSHFGSADIHYTDYSAVCGQNCCVTKIYL